jgi:uncharacterized membrane protein YidH (DUF202 family)
MGVALQWGNPDEGGKEMTARKIFEFGGYAAAAILVAFGVAALVLGVNGRSEVRTNVKREQIVGTPDMTKDGILAEAKQAKLPASVLATLPTCNVAGKLVNNGDRSKCFASYMRIHALEATGGKTYAQMGRFLTKDGKDTNDAALAAKDPKTGNPVENGARNVWVTETALATALNMAFFAEQVSNFGIVVAIALILAGLGFGILAFAAFRWLPAYDARAQATAKAAEVKATP